LLTARRGYFSEGHLPFGSYKEMHLFTVTETDARLGDRRGVYTVLVGKPEGKRPLRRPRRRGEDNIKMDLQEVECEGIDWIDVAHYRDRWRALVNAVMNL
jgi:hypothetical protein